MRSTRILAAAALVAAGACADPRPRPEDGACPTWKDDIAPELAASCTSCHGGAAPAGSYYLGSYQGALGGGTDETANAIAGDASSLLIVTIAPATADGPHAGFGELHALLARWVTTCDLAYFDTPIHPADFLDPHQDGFHGAELERRDWDFPLCATCHGEDFRGTTKAPSCTSCHTRGPTACDTCHPARPTSNAHPTHLDRDIDCTTCHQVPAAWNDEGHILVGGHADHAPAEVTLTGKAAAAIDPGDRTGPPAYDPATSTCSQVYCHGDVLGNAGGQSSRPVWTNDPAGPAPCSSCHGAPPPSHAPRTSCAGCHPSPTGDTHINVALEIGNGLPGCSACHGSETSPAPPRDLEGNTLTTALGVGAHQGHLQGLHRLATPLPCSTCHVVPTNVTDPGHIDSTEPAEVKAALGWDRTSQTCATASCHGPARPVWTDPAAPACGSCHGIPPSTPPHQANMTLSSCTTCHPSTVDAFGNIRFSGPPGNQTSTHINGVAP